MLNTALGFNCANTVQLNILVSIITKNNWIIWYNEFPWCKTSMAANPPNELWNKIASVLNPIKPLVYPSKYF